MKYVSLEIPYPPSVNKLYYNRKSSFGILHYGKKRGRILTPEARAYKIGVSSLIHYQFPQVKFGKEDVKVTIIDNPKNRRRDKDNGLKIVFDSIEMSGIIENDRQIVAYEFIPGVTKNPPTWFITIKSFEGETHDQR